MTHHMCSHIIDGVVRPDDNIHIKSIAADSLESDHHCTKSYFNVSASKPSTTHRIIMNIAKIGRPSIISHQSVNDWRSG